MPSEKTPSKIFWLHVYSDDEFYSLHNWHYIIFLVQSPKPPEYIFWYHNDRMINYGSTRDLSIQTETGSKTQSRLIIENAQVTDSGNYTCETANAEPASTLVYISQGDKMAAIQRRKSDGSSSGSTSSVVASSSSASSAVHPSILSTVLNKTLLEQLLSLLSLIIVHSNVSRSTSPFQVSELPFFISWFVLNLFMSSLYTNFTINPLLLLIFLTVPISTGFSSTKCLGSPW